MDVEKNIHGRIQSWLEKITIPVTQIADRANDSLQDIKKLDDDHPMRVALKEYTPHTNKVVVYRLQDWRSREPGSQPEPHQHTIESRSSHIGTVEI